MGDGAKRTRTGPELPSVPVPVPAAEARTERARRRWRWRKGLAGASGRRRMRSHGDPVSSALAAISPFSEDCEDETRMGEDVTDRGRVGSLGVGGPGETASRIAGRG